MAPTAVIFLPNPGGNPSSSVAPTTAPPTSIIITHIFRTYKPTFLGSYGLDHRLLVDTSSLLPGHTAPRRYTHFLTLSSHFPGKTFVGTTASGTTGQSKESTDGSASESKGPLGEFTLITIPSQPDTLFPLLMQRMSPLWVPRQAHRVEGGASFVVNDWKVRIGELRISGGQGQGRARGCICEVEFLGASDGEEGGVEPTEEIVRAFFEGLVHDSGVDLGGLKVIAEAPGQETQLVQRYMGLLKFARA